jgi:hypothetical protein
MIEQVAPARTNVWDALIATLNPRSSWRYERTVTEYEKYCENHPTLKKLSEVSFLSFLSSWPKNAFFSTSINNYFRR